MKGTALITGSTGGLGSAVAARMAADGYRLILHYHQHKEKAEQLRDSLPGLPGHHLIVAADLRIEDQIAAMAAFIEKENAQPDILINNAGIPFSGLSWKQTAADWDELFSVNTKAPWLVSKYLIPMMRQKTSGRIVYFSSVVAHRPPAGTTAYAASKAALEGLTRAQAVELSKFGITVNCIAPGYFDAGMISSVDETIRQDIIRNTPAQRLGMAEELAEAVLYLCSSTSSFTTGQIIHINGGLYI